MKLQFKILALLVPFVVLPLLVLGWTVYADARNSAAEERLGRAETLLDQLERRFAQDIATTRANARVIANMDLIERYVLVDNEADRYELDQPTLLAQFAEFQKVYPSYIEIKLLWPDGYEDTRSTLSLLPNATEEEADTEFFQIIKAADEHLIDRVLRNPDDGQPVLMVSGRIQSIDPGEDPSIAVPITRGYLVITSTLASLNEFARRLVANGEEELILIDDSGHTIISPELSSESSAPEILLPKDALENFRGLIRTVLLVSVFASFIDFSARLGTIALAANSILLRLLNLAAYLIDGAAFACESLGGILLGRRDRDGLKRLVRLALVTGLLFAGLCLAVYLARPRFFLGLLCRSAEGLRYPAEPMYSWLSRVTQPLSRAA